MFDKFAFFDLLRFHSFRISPDRIIKSYLFDAPSACKRQSGKATFGSFPSVAENKGSSFHGLDERVARLEAAFDELRRSTGSIPAASWRRFRGTVSCNDLMLKVSVAL